MSFTNTFLHVWLCGPFYSSSGMLTFPPPFDLAKDQLTEVEVDEEHDAEADAEGTVAPH